MKTHSKTSRTPAEGMSSLWVAAGRFLILFMAALIVVMPWTEYFWDFDRFLRGGQDCEFGLLALATILCLVLVLLQHGKRGIAFIMALRRWLSFLFHRSEGSRPGCLRTPVSVLRNSGPPGPALSRYNLPLQV